MKISYKWLQEYFDQALPKPQDLAELILLHSYEVEEVLENKNDIIINIDVLPNRSHDSLGHYGVAKEVSAITGVAFKPIEFLDLENFPESNLEIENLNQDFCKRYMGCVIEDVKIEASPTELKEKLEAIGEKSINNIVDITNLVMFSLGQPMHAFDKDKVSGDKILIREAVAGEQIKTLDNKEVNLSVENFVIADSENVLAIAGVKGGKKAEVDLNTKNIILEAANFDPVSVRKTSRALNILTESSKRFENEITPELVRPAMAMAIELIQKYASTEETKIYKPKDFYQKPVKKYKTGVSLSEVNKLLGTDYAESDVSKALDLLGFDYQIVEPRKIIQEEGLKLIDKPYKFGASVMNDSPDSFDCSSLTSYLYSLAGLSIPRNSVDQLFFGEEISKEQALPGDLVFGNSEDGKIWFESQEFLPGTKFEEGVDHVGIYLGDGKVLHSSRYSEKGSEIAILKELKSFKKIVGYRKLLLIEEKRFAVVIPFERLDIRNETDLVEEVGRILGYQNVKEQEIKIPDFSPKINKEHYLTNLIKKTLTEYLNFSEVITYAFVNKGQISPIKPISEDKAFLRDSLEIGFSEALDKNILNADWLLLNQIKIFEIGKVFKDNQEILMLGLGVINKNGFKKPKAEDSLKEAVEILEQKTGLNFDAKIKDGQSFLEINLTDLLSGFENPDEIYPKLIIDNQVDFKNISIYPFMIRDIAVWIPNDQDVKGLIEIIKEKTGALLIKEPHLFDEYKKEDKTSYAFRLIFQSYEKTLTDEEVNLIMQEIEKEIKNRSDWEIR